MQKVYISFKTATILNVMLCYCHFEQIIFLAGVIALEKSNIRITSILIIFQDGHFI